MATRIPVLKTYKLFIGGKFPRSESARYYQIKGPKGKLIANAARGSRKDIRDAVRSAREAWKPWADRSAYNRGQILYRIAEILEERRSVFVDEICAVTRSGRAAATTEVAKSVDRLIWYAGWADKYMQLFSTVNPVASPYWNFSYPDSTGVVGIVAPEEKSLLGLISKIAPAMASGNTCVVIASESAPLSSITFAEVLAASDVPSGVVNIITGFKAELTEPLARHMDVNAIDYSGRDEATIKALQEAGALNVKRVIIRRDPHGESWLDDSRAQSPYWISELTETKTAWHPVGV
ncbi:MAG: aldehyde dehydrogenase family protein [Deltaproteobacteria bacterium]|nr:aldehyde dehydrogenase family protein [Deltaproteobacteria bacterium]